MHMAILLSFPVLGITLVLQTAIAGRIHLLSGTFDLILLVLAAWALQEQVKAAWVWAVLGGLMVGIVSGLPWYVPLFGYLVVVGVGRLLTRRVWQAPLLAMFSITFMGSLIMGTLSLMVLRFFGAPLPMGEAYSLVILPSILLNLLASIPVFWLVRDMARRLYPAAVDA